MKTIDEFREFYGTGLRPTLETFEARRKKILNGFLGITAGVIAAVAALAMFVPGLQHGHGLPITIFIGIAIIAVTWWAMTKDFVRQFKHAVIGPIVEFCDPNLDYLPEQGISEGAYMSSGIFKTGVDRYSREDLVQGTLGATAVRFSEVHSEYKTETRDSKGRRRTQWHTIFKGLFFIGDFNKAFHGRTYVLPDQAERLMGFIGKALQGVFKHSGELVKLEDPEFEKYFVVYGDDQVEARYILSTSLMRRIVEFKKDSGRSIFLSFVASNVNVAISMNKDMFEPRIFRTLLDFSVAQAYLEDLQFAMGIVDELNLNTRIWTKE